MTTSAAACAILRSGLADWVSLGEARYLTTLVTPQMTPLNARKATLSAVSELIDAGLAQAGDLRPEFLAWPRQDMAAEHIARLWVDPASELLPGDICWIANTLAGDALADGFVNDS